MTEIKNLCRCNKCYTVYDENITECEKCGTDEYLMQPFMTDYKEIMKAGGQMKIFYAVDGEGFDNSFEMETNWTRYRAHYIAEEAAKQYHQNHDGWEATWPLDFEIFLENGESLGIYTVEREYEPFFSAMLKAREDK